MKRWLGAVVLLYCMAGGCQRLPESSRARGVPVELEFKMAKTRFIPGESLVAELIIANPGSTSVSVPSVADSRNQELAYVLHGPTFAQDLIVHYGVAGARTPAGEPSLVSVAAGARLSTNLEFGRYAERWVPGTHTLRAVMTRGGTQVESNTITFDIQNAQTIAAQVMAQPLGTRTGAFRAVVLAEAGGERRLYQGFFGEARPGLEAPPTRSFVEMFAVPNATNVTGVWTNFAQAGSMVSPRYVWQSAQFAAVQEFQSPPLTIENTGEQLARPAMMTADATVHLVRWNGERATLVEVPRVGASVTTWDVTLPVAPVSARVAMANDRIVTALFVAQTQQTIRLFLVREGRIVATTQIADAALLPQSEPALWVAADGSTRAALLVAKPEQPTQVSLVEWTWSVAGPVAEPSREPAATLSQAAKAAVVSYAWTAGSPRRDWVILCGDSILVSSRSPGTPRLLRDAPMLPLQMLTTDQMSFLLMTHPLALVYLTSLN